MQVKAGTYTGDGADNRGITGVGFQPDCVWVKSSGAQEWVCRTSTMSGDLTKLMGSATAALIANMVQSLDADGFTVGTNNRVNQNATVFYYVALRDNGASDFKVGTYTGDGTDNRDITGVGFQPTAVVYMGDHIDYPGWNLSGTDLTARSSPGAVANLIQAFGADGFQLGSSVANTNATVYHYIAFKDVASACKVGSYTGDGADNRSISGVGFQPDFALVQSYSGSIQVAVIRFKDNAGDNSAPVSATALTANHIQAFESDGFQVGTSANVNTNAVTYRYLALKEVAGGGTDVTVSPSLLTATLTLHAPTVSAIQNVTVSPSLLTMTTTLHAPTVTAGADAAVTPALLSMALTLHEPFTETYQIARPIADVSVGNWTKHDDGTTDLYATLDETTADDDDYIQSPESPAAWDETKVRLASMVDPNTSDGHTLRFRYQKDSGTDRIDLLVSLYAADGTTLITQVGYADIGTDLLDGVIDLSAPNADAIPSADYAIGLVVGFAAIENTGVGGGVPPWI